MSKEGGHEQQELTRNESDVSDSVVTDLASKIESRLPDRPIPPKELAEILADQLTVEFRRLVQVSYQGPLPPPAMLKQYEEAQTGLASKIIARADKEQDFRHHVVRENARLEHRNLTHKALQGYLGQAYAFAIALVAIAGRNLAAEQRQEHRWLGDHNRNVSGACSGVSRI